MIKTDPTMLVYDATPGPWTTADRYDLRHNPCGMDIVKDMNYMIARMPDGATAKGGKAFTETWSNARLICAAPPLLKIAQKLLLWMEECMAACDFNQDDMDLYHELRQTIRTAGGFSSETHWWQGPCICSACGHAWRGVVEIPVEATSPQVPLECSECHQMKGGPAWINFGR